MRYSALCPLFDGTLLTSGIAILIGLPISLGVAIFITEKMKNHKSIGYAVGTLVDLLAAVPSVIFGLWGLIVLAPALDKYVEKPLNRSLGFIPIFAGTPLQTSFFHGRSHIGNYDYSNNVSCFRDVLNAVPTSQREAMYSLGATDWEVTQKSVLPYARSGLFGAFILGLGRAVGETMAVAFLIGSVPKVSAHLFTGGYTLASLLANQLGEASGMFRSALIEIALILFFIALIINVFARLLLWRMTRGSQV